MNKMIQELKNGPTCTYLFLLIQTLFFLYAQIAGTLLYGSGEDMRILIQSGAMYGPLVAFHFAQNWFRLILPIFIHIGLTHFALNSVTLYFFGKQLEGLYGHTRFLILYLLSGLLGNVASFAFNIGGLSAGASTALFGMFGAFIILRRYFPHNIAITSLSQQYLMLIALNIFVDFFSPKIDLWGHIGGLLGGVLLGALLAVPRESKRYNIHERILAGILFVFALVLCMAFGFKQYGFF